MPPATGPETKAAATPSVQRLKTCRHCSKTMPPGSLFRHEHVTCPKRPGAEAGSRPRGTRKNRRRTLGRPSKVRASLSPAATPEAKVNGCLFCAGPEAAAAKDLFARCVRGGMAFDPAMELVRDICRRG